jgi:hypothetical protein
LNVIKGDHYSAEVWDNHNQRFVVKAYLHECSCCEWQHTGKPCHHALSLITAQQIRDVMMSDFVHEYYSMEMFRKAYAKNIESLCSKGKWPKVDLSFQVGAPLKKRVVGRQRKNSIKGCLEGGSGRSKSSSKVAENQNEKTKKWAEAKCNVLTVESWDTGKQATYAHLMEQRKGKIYSSISSHVYFIYVLFT